MNYELLMKGIDGEVWSLDLPLDAPAMNYQINNLAELKDRNASYSQRISLPRTTHNEQAFQFCFVVGSGSYVPYMKFPCQLFYEGALISPAGAVLNIVDVSDTSIGVQIVGAIADLFDTLNRLNTDSYNSSMFLLEWYYKSMGTSKGSFPDTTGGGNPVSYLWLFSTIQKNPNNPPVSMESLRFVDSMEKYYPHINWFDLVRWIFGSQGYGFESDVAPEDANQMYLPCTYPTLYSGGETPTYPPRLDGVGWIQEPPTGTIVGINWQGYPGRTIADPIDGRLLMGVVSGQFFWKTLFDTRVRFAFSWTNPSAIYSGTIAVKVTHYKKDGTTEVPVERSWSSGTTGSVIQEINMEAGEYLVVSGSLATRLDPGNQWDLRTPVTIIAFPVDGVSPGDKPMPGLTYNCLASTGFKTLGDIVKAFVQLFGLILEVDSSQKVVRAYSMNEIYRRRNKAEGRDWSNKLVVSKDTKLTFQLSNYAQSNEIKLEDNKDNNVTDSYKFDIVDVNIQPSKTLFTIGFLAGLNQTLYDEGSGRLFTLANYPIWEIVRGTMQEDGTMSETTWEYNTLSKPMVVHTNMTSPRLCQVDVGHSIKSIQLYTAYFKSLNYYVPKYYGKLIDNILKRPKILQTQILLDPLDIQSLDLFNPIWLKEHGFWFYVSKINNFQAGKITKVDLIRM